MRAMLMTVGVDLTLTGPLPSTAVGQPGAYTLTARGGASPYTISLVSEDLPPEWTITINNDGTVDIDTGEAEDPGEFTLVFRLKDANRNERLITRRIRVVALPLELTGGPLPAITVGVPYSASLTITGGVPPYSALFSTAMDGLAWNVAGNLATLSGTATGLGLGAGEDFNVPVQIRVQDSAMAEAFYAQTMDVTVPELTLTGLPPDAEENDPYSFDLTRAGGIPGPLTIVSQADLPPDLIAAPQSNTVRIAGTPDPGTSAGSPYSAVVVAQDSEGNQATWNESLVVTAAPAHDYATLNPADKSPNVTLSGGDLVYTTSVTNYGCVRATQGKSSGKWYWETLDQAPASFAWSGIAQDTATLTGMFIGEESVSISSPFPGGGNLGNCFRNGSVIAYYPGTVGAPTVVRHMLDMDAGTYEIARGGGSFLTVETGLTGTWYPAFTARRSSGSGGVNGSANFGASAFVYSVPIGFNAGVYV